MTIKQQGGVFGRNPTFNDVTIEGELTFDGDIDVNSDLKVNGDLDVIGAVTADAGSVFDAGTNFVADNDLANKSLIVASSGATGGNGQYGASVAFSRINTTSPRAAIAAIQTDSNYERMGLAFFTHISNNGSDPMNRRMAIKHDGDVVMYNIDSTTESFRWDCSSNELHLGGNVVVASGSGIDFSATAGTGTSELLDDYEEGSWDMVLTSASGSFTTATLDPNATAFYTKIGRHVFIQGYFMTDAITAGTASGDIYISLPFAVAALTGFGDQGVGATGTALSWGGDFPFAVSPRGGDTKMNIHYRTSANGSTSNMQVGDLATGANSNVMVFTAQYIAA
jgi:hypothetical protein